MKQKIVVSVSLNGQDSRCKAMKTAVDRHGHGIQSIAWKGENQLEVVGDGIDVAKLTKQLKKKVGRTDAVSVNLVDTDGKKGSGGDGGNPSWTSPYGPYPPPHGIVVPGEIYYEDQPACCTIM